MKLIYLFILFFFQSLHAESIILCDVNNGLNLINRTYYSPAQIESILNSCDKISPNAPSVLLLHGLFARKNQQNEQAVIWLQKAMLAAPDNLPIILELATTYELMKQWNKAQELYGLILAKSPEDRAALLGLARIFRLQKQYDKALAIYKKFLLVDPHDTDALNGMGWISSAQNDLARATNYFEETLKIQPENEEALTALKNIKLTELQKQGPPILCDATQGLNLLNQQKASTQQINQILEQCSVSKIENADTLLLRGLLARREALQNNHYNDALFWLKKAAAFSSQLNQNIYLELAITYEWANQFNDALLIYQHILLRLPENRLALLGKARALKALKEFNEARKIYQQLLIKNPRDLDALNGMGWLELAQNQTELAKQFFKKSLSINPANQDANRGLKESAHKIQVANVAPTVSLCDADEGLILLNAANPPFQKIQKILARCDRNTPNQVSNLLLHGLLARHVALQTGDYQHAITWLTKAAQYALPANDLPALELATTYEWAGEFNKSLALYQLILAKSPNNRAALLGKARVLRFSYQIEPSLQIYRQLLIASPNNKEALIGLGEAYMANYEFDKANVVFNRVLTLDPDDQQVKKDLSLLAKATKNMLDFTIGDYRVPPEHANGFNLNYFRNLNATDGLTLYATHNTRQIESNFGIGPTLLPNNSLLIGYQHLVPQQHGWQVSYDARQHDHLPFEHRLFGAANLFLQKNLEWYGGLRLIFPDIWNTQLLTSGMTVYTNLPVNVSLTGFWAFQEIGGYNSSYSLDFNKEYNNHLFYNFGSAYLVEQKSMEIHGRLIFPVSQNQALMVQGSHYFFNDSTFINAGWRVYWA
ncbi:tetratricopeptide repeat protein [Legionella septentrionalis]|uniref:Tetratricopeptide repeat protein n=1 Tax=Legionella septentrionalis TaxID=2498109 RepID=A0A433JHB0_9GAMM|nr:tetratricopeptide repeat protein [Legionella septentrionalis]RUQ81569.1 tetratricopeptide repeat protein [Legionella septentrionalis]